MEKRGSALAAFPQRRAGFHSRAGRRTDCCPRGWLAPSLLPLASPAQSTVFSWLVLLLDE